MQHFHHKKGFTLIELLVSLTILTCIIFVLSRFEGDVFDLGFSLYASMDAQLSARHVVKTMVTQLRGTTQSATGTYAIALASSTGITFFSDVNGDGTIEQVRYFLNGTNITMGITSPTGSPATYNPANEVLSTVIGSVMASSTAPIFQYYDENYAGTSTPLAQPVNVSSIRLVKITVIIDSNPNRSPAQLVETSQVMMRNLKDNL